VGWHEATGRNTIFSHTTRLFSNQVSHLRIRVNDTPTNPHASNSTCATPPHLQDVSADSIAAYVSAQIEPVIGVPFARSNYGTSPTAPRETEPPRNACPGPPAA
jgi:hypothetical protein